MSFTGLKQILKHVRRFRKTRELDSEGIKFAESISKLPQEQQREHALNFSKIARMRHNDTFFRAPENDVLALIEIARHAKHPVFNTFLARSVLQPKPTISEKAKQVLSELKEFLPKFKPKRPARKLIPVETQRAVTFKLISEGKSKQQVVSFLKEKIHLNNSLEEIERAHFPQSGFWSIDYLFRIPREKVMEEFQKKLESKNAISKGVREKWLDPNFALKVSNSMTQRLKTLWQDPAYVEKQVKESKEREFDAKTLGRKKQASSDVLKKLWADKKMAEKFTLDSARRGKRTARKLWQTPGFRKKQLAAVLALWDDEEFRTAHSERQTKLMKDKTYKKKALSGLERVRKDPENLKKLAEQGRRKFEDEEFRERFFRANLDFWNAFKAVKESPLAQQVKLTPKKLARMLKTKRFPRPKNVEPTARQGEVNEQFHTIDFEDTIFRKEVKTLLTETFSSLSPLQTALLDGVYGLTQEEKSLEEIAEKLGITPEKAKEEHDTALNLLRQNPKLGKLIE